MQSLKFYTGFDPKDEAALRVCLASLRHHASIPLEVVVIKEHELRRAGYYWRSYRVDERGQMWDDRDGKPFSTHFSFTRFAVPLLAGDTDDWAVWCDPDFLWRSDISALIELCRTASRPRNLWCVQHVHRPVETEKMGGAVLQQHYARKNWSSLMVMRPCVIRAQGLNRYALNNWSGEDLHRLAFQPYDAVGALPEAWNWIAGTSDPVIEPKAVHFTRGTPDMPGHEAEPFADEWRFCLKHGRPAARGGIVRADAPYLVGERGPTIAGLTGAA